MDNNMQLLRAAEWHAPEAPEPAYQEEPYVDDETEAEVKKPFEIRDDTTANWAFQKLAEIQKERSKQLDQYQIYIDQAEEWKRREVGKLEDKATFFQQLIENYRIKQPDGKVNVPAGKTVVRHSNKVAYSDNELLEFVKNNYPKFIKTTIGVKKGDFKKLLKTDGRGHFVDDNGQLVTGMSYEATESVAYKVN